MRLALAAAVLCGCAELSAAGEGESPVRVAAAASLRTVLPQLIEAYREENPEEHIEAVYASTGKLYAQIRAGAPYDLFLAADENYPRLLVQTGLTAEEPRVYARGTLVCISGAEAFPTSAGTADLTAWLAAGEGKVAVANAELAPYGRAYASFYAAFSAGLPAELDPLHSSPESRLVTGENVGQTLQFFMSGGTDCAFVPLALALSAGADLRWSAIDEAYSGEILQAGVPLPGEAGGTSRAEGFWNFLFTDAAAALLRRGGYR